MFAPSIYTWPPCACTTSQISRIVGSKTPCVEGYVTINAARSRACSSAFARRSARSISPSFKHATERTLKPAITALAGFVPCAEVGTRSEEHTSELQSLAYLVCRLLLE